MLFSYILYNIILFGSSLFIYLSEKTKNIEYKITFYIISFSLVLLPAALRYNIGVDYSVYVDIFLRLQHSDIQHFEYGYIYLNKIISYLSLPVEAFFAFSALITYVFIFLSFPSKHKWLYLFLFITSTYLLTYNLLRTSLALSICMYATMNYREKDKLSTYFILVSLASSMHLSALLFLIFPLLSRKPIYNLYLSYKYIVILILLGTFIFKREILDFIIQYLIPALGYGQYLNLDLYMSPPDINSGLGIILRSLPLWAIIFYSDKIITNNPKDIITINIAFVCLCCLFLSSEMEIFARVEKVFFLAYMLSIYIIYINNKIKYRKLLVLFFVFSQLLIFERSIINSSSDKCDGPRISPYVSILNKQDDHSLKQNRLECKK